MVDVEHGDLRAHADRDRRRVAPDHAAAEDDDAAAAHAGHAAEEHALAAVLLLEARRADLHRHAAGDLAHRAEQRKRAVVELDRLVGDAATFFSTSSGVSSGLGREVEVRVEDQVLAEEAVLGGASGSFTFTTMSARPGLGRAGRRSVRPRARSPRR